MDKFQNKKRTDIDLLFNFANADLTNMDTRLRCSTVMERLWKHPSLHEDNRVGETGGDSDLIMDVLQRHLRSRFRKVVKNSMMLGSMPLWRISGSVSLELDPIRNCFQEQFKLRRVKKGNEVKALKKVVDQWLIEIIRDLNFKPRRFGRCHLCGGFFFQPTIKEKRFCSERCGNTARQQKYRKERRNN